MNKRIYISPEAEIESFSLIQNICTLSDNGFEESDNFGDLGDGGVLEGGLIIY